MARSAHPRFDSRDAVAGDNNLGPLPEWDLSDLYAGPDAPEITRDVAWLARRMRRFRQ